MFLVQINKASFIDAEKIECVWFNQQTKELCVQMTGTDNGEHYIVDRRAASSFLNDLASINKGVAKFDGILTKALSEGLK